MDFNGVRIMVSISYVSISIIIIHFTGLAQCAKDNPACIVDPEKAATATDNYMDCAADEMVAAGTTECCTRDKSVGCCKPNARWDKMIAIGCGIGVTFVVLALILIYLLWCKKDTIPCLGRCQDRIERKYYAVEEKIWCCQSRVQQRKQVEEIMKKATSEDIPAYTLPDEIEDTKVQDEWWQGQFIKNA